jgi:hypothetical protein
LKKISPEILLGIKVSIFIGSILTLLVTLLDPTEITFSDVFSMAFLWFFYFVWTYIFLIAGFEGILKSTLYWIALAQSIFVASIFIALFINLYSIVPNFPFTIIVLIVASGIFLEKVFDPTKKINKRKTKRSHRPL